MATVTRRQYTDLYGPTVGEGIVQNIGELYTPGRP